MSGEKVDDRIPVIDLAFFTAEQERLLLSACQGPGCFRITGHGIPGSLMTEMKTVAKALFDLPEELKLCDAAQILGSGYMKPEETPHFEFFGIYDAASPADIDAFCSILQTSPQQRDTIKIYTTSIHGLAVDVAGKIAASIGVNGCSFEGWSSQLRLNKFPFTANTTGSFGVDIHTDPGFLTVLQPDDCVGGLEIIDAATGSGIPVAPLPGSLLINLGDIAKAWSNGRMQNAKHRVLCKEGTMRMSMAIFLLGPENSNVEAPEILVDDEHPRLFRPFTFAQLRRDRISSQRHAGEALFAYML